MPFILIQVTFHLVGRTRPATHRFWAWRRLHPVQTGQLSAAGPARPARPPLPADLDRVHPAAPGRHRRPRAALRQHPPARPLADEAGDFLTASSGW